MFKSKQRVSAVFGLILVGLLSSCTATQPSAVGVTEPGFILGLWQGFTAPITFFVSLFNEDVRIYSFPNAGRWYDFGFMLGISGFSGGVFESRRRRKDKR